MKGLTVIVKGRESGALSKFKDGTYEFRRKVPAVEELVSGSFLTAEAQVEYLRIFHDRLKMFK